MANIFVARRIPSAGIELLAQAGHTVTVPENDAPFSPEELRTALSGKEYDALLPTHADHITKDIIASLPNLRIIANYAVGFDNIDREAARAQNIIVTNTPDVLTDAVAEHALALLFTCAKRIVEADRFMRENTNTPWGPLLFLTPQMKGKTLGLVGVGRIGGRVAELGACIGLRIVYFDVKRNDNLEHTTRAEYRASADDVLREADFVSLHVPLLDSTRHLINVQRLSLMKSTAILVNTSRGAVVDEAALIEALSKNAIRAAALDVFEQEPEFSPALRALSNVVLTPHMASGTEEARNAMSTLAAQSIIDFFAGRTPAHVVR